MTAQDSPAEREERHLLVMKFGGTSVGSAEAIRRTAEIVRATAAQWPRLVTVVSAMSGVTDALTQGALTAITGDHQHCRRLITDLRARHYAAIDGLLAPEGERHDLLATVDDYLARFDEFCRSLHILGEVTPRALDAVTSLGEQLSARILAARLRQEGTPAEAVDATGVIVTDDHFQGANPLLDETRERAQQRLSPLLDQGILPIVTGFIGATVEGITTTLGRGGSDYSAAILGAVLGADEVWIWTDVDGVMTADPRIVPEARTIPVLSYTEVAELAYFGAKVLHPKTIRPVVERSIPLRVKNTFYPDRPGTLIVRTSEAVPGTIKAVTLIRGMSLVTVEGTGMMGVPGVAARTFAAVARTGTSVLMISQASSEQSICFVIPTPAVPPVVAAIEEEMALELLRRDIDRVWAQEEVAIVTVVGAGMRQTPGVAARIFSALGERGINVIAIAQGSSECSISLVVTADEADEAVRALHQLTGEG